MTKAAPFFRIELANDRDEADIDRGERDAVRTAIALGVLNPAQLRVHIPGSVADRLGLRIEKCAAVRVTWRGREDVDMAAACRITICGRTDVFRVVVDPAADVCTVGGMALMVLDLVIDQQTGFPIPRDPNERVIDI